MIEPLDEFRNPPPSTTAAFLAGPTVMSDQEIRARGLECAVRLPQTIQDGSVGGAFWALVQQFEAYIRDGR